MIRDLVSLQAVVFDKQLQRVQPPVDICVSPILQMIDYATDGSRVLCQLHRQLPKLASVQQLRELAYVQLVAL